MLLKVGVYVFIYTTPMRREGQLKKILIPMIWGCCLLASGCVSIKSGAIFDSPTSKDASVVEAEEEGPLGVLHLSVPEDLTEIANERLLAQCPSGRLENVQDQLSERDYFLIVQSYKVRAKADCVPVPKPAAVTPPPEPQLNAKQTERGLVFTLGSILFRTNKATILPGAEESLDKLAAYLKAEPGRKIMIEGYTDSTGHSSYNMSLSEKRAKNVEAALEKIGVGSDRIESVKGFGDRYPVAANDTAEGRQENRRVEIVISEPNGKFLKDR